MTKTKTIKTLFDVCSSFRAFVLNAYEKPTCRVVVLQHKANILVGSPVRSTPPEEIPEYDDWFEYPPPDHSYPHPRQLLPASAEGVFVGK